MELGVLEGMQKGGRKGGGGCGTRKEWEGGGYTEVNGEEEEGVMELGC